MKNLALAKPILLVILAASVAVSFQVFADASSSKPRLAIVQVPMNVRVKRLSLISSDSTKDRELQKLLISVRLRQADAFAKSSLVEDIERGTGYAVLKDSATEDLIESLDLAHNDGPIPISVLREFQEATLADAVLRFRVTDYGRTPRVYLKWVYAATAVWIGGVVTLATFSPRSRPYVGAYLLSEVVQEGAEAYLGTSLFGHEYKPVRVEAELLDGKSGRVLWHGSATRTASTGVMKSFPRAERDRKEIQLAVATDRAISSLVDGLKKLQRT